MIQPESQINIKSDGLAATMTTMDKFNFYLIAARTGIMSYGCVGEHTNENIESIQKFSKETSYMKIFGYVLMGVFATYTALCLSHMYTLNPPTSGFDFLLVGYLVKNSILSFMSVMFILLKFFLIETKHGSTIALFASLSLTANWVTIQYIFSTILIPYSNGALLAFLLAVSLLGTCFMAWYLYTCQSTTRELLGVQLINAVIFAELFYHFMTIKSDHFLAAVFVVVVCPLVRKSSKAYLSSMSEEIIGRPTPWIGVALIDCYYLFFLALTIQHSEGFTTMIAILIFNCLSFLLEHREYMDIFALKEKTPGTVKQSHIMLEDSAMLSFYEIMVPFIYSMLIRFIVKLSPNRDNLVIFHEYYYTKEQFDQTKTPAVALIQTKKQQAAFENHSKVLRYFEKKKASKARKERKFGIVKTVAH